MNSFPLLLPVKEPGIYMLKNIATKQIYIGQTENLRRRMSEWRAIANGSIGGAPAQARISLNLSDITNWEFVVICEMRGASKADLRNEEEKAIVWAKEKFGDMVINTSPPVREQVLRGNCVPGVPATALTIITYKGEPISTYREAAEILGVKRASLVKQVAAYRAKGQNHLTIEFLQSKKKRA